MANKYYAIRFKTSDVFFYSCIGSNIAALRTVTDRKQACHYSSIHEASASADILKNIGINTDTEVVEI